MSAHGFEDLGGTTNDDMTRASLTYWFETDDAPACVTLEIDGGDGNFATITLAADNCKRLRNLMAMAERRFKQA